ncbi:MAG: aminopeptidase N C-terminal domain-containing protein, partial [Alphaproteobacteria bacterium]|nr:aminopeptidase N C-terminal domain-containing protein [Alphaproteobacteria bacterium]
MVHDTDGFNKWESGQRYYLSVIQQLMDGKIKDVPQEFLDSVGQVLDQALDGTSDKALLARALQMPSFTRVAQEQDIIDPDKIDAALTTLKKAIKREHKAKLGKIYNTNRSGKEFNKTPEDMGQRALCNTTLGLLTATKGTGCANRAQTHYYGAYNMTNRVAAINALLGNKNVDRERVLQDFYDEFKEHQLVIDKWFSMQATAKRDDIFEVLENLRAHPDFNIKNPNRVRSLIGSFAMGNPVAFHSKDGRGYEFLKNAIIELNDINPQMASRMLTPLREWRKYTPDRQEKMKAALEEIAALPNVSPNVYELATKALGHTETEQKAPTCQVG